MLQRRQQLMMNKNSSKNIVHRIGSILLPTHSEGSAKFGCITSSTTGDDVARMTSGSLDCIYCQQQTTDRWINQWSGAKQDDPNLTDNYTLSYITGFFSKKIQRSLLGEPSTQNPMTIVCSRFVYGCSSHAGVSLKRII